MARKKNKNKYNVPAEEVVVENPEMVVDIPTEEPPTVSVQEQMGLEASDDNSTEKEESPIDKGILLYHATDGKLKYQMMGSVNLENLTYYRRFLERIEENLWAINEKDSDENGAE